MRSKMLAFLVAFSVLALTAGASHALGSLGDPSCTSPSACCAVEAICLALDDKEAIQRFQGTRGYGKETQWFDAIRRSVKASAWDTSRVWVQIAPLFWLGEGAVPAAGGGIFGPGEFEPIRLVERERDGVQIAFVTISPAQTLLLGWRLRNAPDQVNQNSPLWIDGDYYDKRFRHWHNTMLIPPGDTWHRPEDVERFRRETLPHYPYFADLFHRYRGGATYAVFPDPSRDAWCCCDKTPPLLEHLISLLLREKGRIATITEVVSTQGSELTKLAPDCTTGSYRC